MNPLQDLHFQNRNVMDRKHIEYLTPELLKSEEQIWVNPVGGLGDIIMLSTAMQCSYKLHGKKFLMVRRSQYTEFFAHHPAVEAIGHPEGDPIVVCNDYWMRADFQNPDNKALAIVKKIFAVDDDGDDTLFIPEVSADASTQLLINTIPWGQKNVVISCSSESPRKMMHPIKWHAIVDQLLSQQCFVIQVGRMGDIPIQGCYSLLGATSPLQLIEVLKRTQLVITPDNFIMHMAKAVGVPAITLFGPTEASRYGYKDQVCLQADVMGCEFHTQCLGPHVSQNYSTPCPMCERHCMNTHDERKIIDIALSILQ